MIIRNHKIVLEDTSPSEMARFRQIMLDIWHQQIEDDKNAVEMENFIKQKYNSENKILPKYITKLALIEEISLRGKFFDEKYEYNYKPISVEILKDNYCKNYSYVCDAEMYNYKDETKSLLSGNDYEIDKEENATIKRNTKNNSSTSYPVYGVNGEYLGEYGIKNKSTDLAYIGEKNGKDNFKNIKQFTDKHTEFQKASNIIKKESSGDKIESLWIAHTANNAQKNNLINWKKNKNADIFAQLMDQNYSTTPSSARKPLSIEDNSNSAMNARAGLINVLSGGEDPTNNAVLWDGFDFLNKSLKSNKFKEYGYIRIDSKHLKTITDFYSWQSNKNKVNKDWAVDCIFEMHGKEEYVYTFNNTFWTGVGNESKIHQGIRSTGAYGGTIFWNIYKR